MRELASLIDADPGNLSRELKKLEEEGLYVSLIRGRSKFYSLNKEYPLFHDLKNILFKTEGVEGSLKGLVSRFKGISFAFVYGSYAKERERKTSDIDVVVGECPRDKFTRYIRELESRLSREVNFTIYTKEEFERERRKAGGFLNLVLKEKIITLKGDLNAG